MRVRDESPERLVLVEPNTGHKMFFAIAAVAFGIGTVGVVASPDTPIVAAAIPAVISLSGIAGLRYGGKPNVTTLDHGADVLRMETYPGSFSKAVVTEHRLSDVVNAALEANRGGSRTTYGIVLTLAHGESVQVGMSERGRGKMERRAQRIAEFLGVPFAV